MSQRFPTAILLALLVGCVPPPKAALASPSLAQAPSAPSVQAPPAVPTPPSTAAPPGPPAIVLNFDDADIEAVIQTVSEVLGFNYVLAPDVRGKVTVHTPRAIRREDVFSVFLSILEVHGFTAVKAGDVYKIVRTERARERAIRTFIGPMPGQSPRGTGPAPASGAAPPTPPPPVPPAAPGVQAPPVPPHSGTTRPPGTTADQVHVIPLHFADASYLAGILNEVFARAGVARPPVIVADRRTNSLVIRARRSDVEAIGRLLGRVN